MSIPFLFAEATVAAPFILRLKAWIKRFMTRIGKYEPRALYEIKFIGGVLTHRGHGEPRDDHQNAGP
jgi:hypothetical protein